MLPADKTLDENVNAGLYSAEVRFLSRSLNMCYKLTSATAIHYLASSSCFQCLLCLISTIFCSFQDQWDLC